MNSELMEALDVLEKEKKISKEVLIEAIENSLLTACKSNYGKSDNFTITIDRVTGDYTLLAAKEVVEVVEDDIRDIILEIINKLPQDQRIAIYLYYYQDMTVKSEVIATTDQYFTLKLMCFQSAGSSAEWDYYYTIDLTTGERLKLADLFQDGSNYLFHYIGFKRNTGRYYTNINSLKPFL